MSKINVTKEKYKYPQECTKAELIEYIDKKNEDEPVIMTCTFLIGLMLGIMLGVTIGGLI